MSQSDVAMEDAEAVAGNNIQESGSKVCGDKAEENIPLKDSALGVANVGQDLQTVANEERDMTATSGEFEGKINPSDDEAKPMNEQGSLGQQSISEIKNEKNINEKSKAEELVTARSEVVKQTDGGNDMAGQNTTNVGVGEDTTTHNDLEGETQDKNVMNENSSENDVDINEEAGKEDGNCGKHVTVEEKSRGITDSGNDPEEIRLHLTKLSDGKAPQSQKVPLAELPKCMGVVKSEGATNVDEDGLKEPVKKEIIISGHVSDGNAKTAEISASPDNLSHPTENEAATPISLTPYCPAKTEDHSGEPHKTVFTQMAEGDDGTLEEQAAFMRELENFYRERAMDFKPPKFYGQPLNCLKLWRAVIRLGGYDWVTGSKLWRQVGESFHPPKTCTTVSWTFRIFYEKSLLEYEKHKRLSGELQLPVPSLTEASGVDGEENGYQGSGSGRARRDAAARAMQGWHVQRLFGNGEVGEPVIKDKNLNNTAKREKNLKSIGSLKQKRPNEVEHPAKAARTETSKQLVTPIVDVGPPADWVKINVLQNKDCFEVYALVPGLLREEVRVQSDPAGRLVITGQPEQPDNPWGITPFKKVVSLPARIDPIKTSAVVSLHGRLFVRVPIEQSNV